MFDTGSLPIYVRPGFTDGRKSIDGLVGVIQNQMQLDVLQGGLFIFCSKARTTIKCVLCFTDNYVSPNQSTDLCDT
jgi:transposase